MAGEGHTPGWVQSVERAAGKTSPCLDTRATQKAAEHHEALAAVLGGTQAGSRRTQDSGLAPVNHADEKNLQGHPADCQEREEITGGCESEREQGPRIKGSGQEASSPRLEESA